MLAASAHGGSRRSQRGSTRQEGRSVMTRTRRLLIVLATLVLASGAFAGTAFADQVSYLSGKVRTGDVVTVPANETVRTDLYVFASMVTIDGTIDGDLVTTGSQITVNGSVNGSSGAYTRSGSRGGTEEVTISGSGGGAQRTPVARDPVVDAARQLAAVLVVGLLFLWLRPRLLPAWDALLRARPAAAAGY